MNESDRINARGHSNESDPALYKVATPKPVLLGIIPLILALSLVFAWIYVVALSHANGERSDSTTNAMGGDFVLPYSAALLAINGAPERAYDIGTIHEMERKVSGDAAIPAIPWPYPPFFQLLIMPLAHLSYITAYRIYVVLTIVMLIIVAWRIAPSWRTPLLIPIFPAVAFCAAAGQNGNLSAALLGAGLLMLKRKPVTSGIAFGLMAYKPHLAVAIPFCLLAGRHYRALAATALTALSTVLISVIVFGDKPLITFLLNITHHAGIVFGHQSDLWRRMPTVLILMLQLTGSQTLAWLTQGVFAGAALAGVVWIWRGSSHEVEKALALAVSIPLITPYFADYDMAIFAIPFVFLTWEVWTKGFAYDRALVIAALWVAPPVIFLLPYWFHNTWQAGPIIWASLFGYAFYRVACGRHEEITV